jgi:hypothetical protein
MRATTNEASRTSSGYRTVRAWQRSGVAGDVRRHTAELGCWRWTSLWPNISTVTPLQQATRIY